MTKEQVAVRKAKAEAFREAARIIDLEWAQLGTRSSILARLQVMAKEAETLPLISIRGMKR